jgi:prefoldin subunit 5
MDWVTIVGLKDVGPWGIIAIFVVSLGYGWIIPRWSHKERIADLKEQLKEKSETIVFLQAALDKRDDQMADLIQSSQVAVTALEAIRREAVRT